MICVSARYDSVPKCVHGNVPEANRAIVYFKANRPWGYRARQGNYGLAINTRGHAAQIITTGGLTFQ